MLLETVLMVSSTNSTVEFVNSLTSNPVCVSTSSKVSDKPKSSSLKYLENKKYPVTPKPINSNTLLNATGMTTKEEKEAKANAAIKPYVPISSSDMLLLEKDGIEEEDEEDEDEDDEDEGEGEEERSSFFFICTGAAILAVGETVALFVITAPPFFTPLKLANKFETTTVCAFFFAGTFAAYTALLFTICFVGLTDCFLIVYCDFTGERFFFDTNVFVFFIFTVFAFGVNDCFGFTVALNFIGFLGCGFTGLILIGFESVIGFFFASGFFFGTLNFAEFDDGRFVNCVPDFVNLIGLKLPA